MWYFKGRRKKYKSPYTGKEVDAAVKKANEITTTPEKIDKAANALSEIISYDGSTIFGVYLSRGKLYGGLCGIAGALNERNPTQRYSPLRTIDGIDAASNRVFYNITFQPTFAENLVYFKRLPNGDFSDSIPNCTGVNISTPTQDYSGVNYRNCIARPYVILLSQEEGASLFTTESLNISLTDEEIAQCPLLNRDLVTKVYIEGLALDSFDGTTWSGVVYSNFLATMNITTPVFITCALTSSGITITAKPFS